MARNQQFVPEREPFKDHPYLRPNGDHISGPISFLNPTSARFKLERPSREEDKTADSPAGSTDSSTPQLQHVWRARDNRKGRHLLEVKRHPGSKRDDSLPRSTASFRSTVHGIVRLFTYFPYWDVSWLVAIAFTVGSCVWVVNAFFVWLQLEDPDTEFNNEKLVGGGVTAFIGATTFEIGSTLMVWEALNSNRTGCFGWALESGLGKAEGQVEDAIGVTHAKPDLEQCRHHHAKLRTSSRAKDGQQKSHDRWKADHAANGDTTFSGEGVTQHGGSDKVWKWLPSLYELRTHYIYELGFQASAIQWIGATIFWISGYTGLPGIQDHMSLGLMNGVYWVPQIVGGSGFIISGFLFMMESQPKWFMPAPKTLGWHVGFWNLIGGIGFTLCGCFGLASTDSGMTYQSSLSTFWGSWAFLIGSVAQWYESLEKHPVQNS